MFKTTVEGDGILGILREERTDREVKTRDRDGDEAVSDFFAGGRKEAFDLFGCWLWNWGCLWGVWWGRALRCGFVGRCCWLVLCVVKYHLLSSTVCY